MSITTNKYKIGGSSVEINKDKLIDKNGHTIDITNIVKCWYSGNDGAGSGLDADKVRGLSADFSSNKNTNGYQKLPSGIIIQWGRVSNNGDGTKTINYPIAFPNKALMGVAQMITSSITQDENSAAWNGKSKSQCYIIVDNGLYTAWIAIGY